jgi:hypothetical protein
LQKKVHPRSESTSSPDAQATGVVATILRRTRSRPHCCAMRDVTCDYVTRAEQSVIRAQCSVIFRDRNQVAVVPTTDVELKDHDTPWRRRAPFVAGTSASTTVKTDRETNTKETTTPTKRRSNYSHRFLASKFNMFISPSFVDNLF